MNLFSSQFFFLLRRKDKIVGKRTTNAAGTAHNTSREALEWCNGKVWLLVVIGLVASEVTVSIF